LEGEESAQTASSSAREWRVEEDRDIIPIKGIKESIKKTENRPKNDDGTGALMFVFMRDAIKQGKLKHPPAGNQASC